MRTDLGTLAASVLVVGDDAGTRQLLGDTFKQKGIESVLAADGRTALERFRRESFELVLLDLELPDMSGLEVLEQLKAHDPNVAILMLTGHGDIPTAVRAIQLGAEQFLTKPVRVDQLEPLIERTMEAVRSRRRNEYYVGRATDAHRLAGLGESPAMQNVIRSVDLLAATDATVLLQGETAVGKGKTAELIHALSARMKGPFVGVNCGGLTSALLDAELFGQEKGASRGLIAMRPGLLEAANGGTLFLDEIGDLAPDLQPKLLHALERRRFRRIGGTREVVFDIRLIAATSRDLREAVSRDGFRDGLYWRLSAHPISLPPLRERGRDAILEMSYHLLADLQRTLGRGPSRISDAAVERLVRHRWPGNIRELRNVLEHVILNAGTAKEVLPRHLPADLAESSSRTASTKAHEWNLSARLQVAERSHIVEALDATAGNRSRAAELIGISRATFYEKLKRHQLIP